MANIKERDTVIRVKDPDGNEYIEYPATRLGNVIGLPAELEKINNRVSALENDDEYGMRWVDGASAPEVTRCLRREGMLYTGADTGLTFSVNSDGSFKSSYSELPIWGEMKRVTLNGQVMVQIPKYYIKREKVDEFLYTWVCKRKKAGYRCAGIFLQSDGVTENDYYYIGAYESTNDSLGKSASGRRYDSDDKPHNTGWTITEYRDAAKAIGGGWGITPIAEACDFWQVLLPMEFGTRDVQDVAAGIVQIVDPPTDDNFPDLKYRTGMCDSVANLHGIYHLTDNSPAGESYNYKNQSGINCGANPFVWHGIENPYGCIFKYTDGLVLYNNKWYASNNREAFASGTVAGYTLLDSYTPPEGAMGYNDGMVKALGSFSEAPYCQLPTEFTDTEYTYFADEFYYGSGNNYYYAAFGGVADYYYGAGVWCFNVSSSATCRVGCYGSRLSYSPV